jgi:hypothetical protein
MAENRWQIIVGALVLLLMLLTGSFSLGVYVGEHGWTREGLRYQPGQGQPPAAGPRAAPPDAAIGRPDIIGRVRSLSAEGLDLATPDGPKLVDLNDDTRVEDVQGASLNLDDLQPGDIVAVFGDFIAGDGRRLLASRIVRLPPGPPGQP